MNPQKVEELLNGWLKDEPLNFMPQEEGGYQVYEGALCKVASADDPLFQELKESEQPGLKGIFKPPKEWMPAAKSVLSIFFYNSAETKKSNYEPGEPSRGWRYARCEAGEIGLPRVMGRLVGYLASEGVNSQMMFGNLIGIFALGKPVSPWSERHAAYVAGMGTFSHSKGLITEKGAAGRLMSMLIAQQWPATPRPYEGLYDNCVHCLACLARCPAQAITENEKMYTPCYEFLKATAEKYRQPLYSCGKCMTKVPCESCIPNLSPAKSRQT